MAKDRPTTRPCGRGRDRVEPGWGVSAARAILLAAVCASACAMPAAARAPGPPPNPIQAENALPGTAAWQAQAGGDIAVYASQIAVGAGDGIDFHVSTAYRYRIVVYRLGWYAGTGARLVACAPDCTSDEQGQAQGPPAGTQPIRAGWPVTDTIRVAGDWTSGYYLAEAVLTTGPWAGKVATDLLRRAPARTDARLEHPRAGPRQHLGGVQRLGRQEPLRLLPATRLRGLVRPAVREHGAVPDVVGDPARALPRARGRRRLLPDRRRHRPRRIEPATSSPRHGRRSRRVLERRDARRLRHGARRRHEPRLHGLERRLLAGQVRRRRPHDRLREVAVRSRTPSSCRRRRCSGRSADPSACSWASCTSSFG